jgi:hypothetical protein
VAALQVVIASADQPMEPTRTQHYEAAATPAGYAVSEESDPLAVVATSQAVRDTIYARSHRRAFELAQLKGWMLLHAGLVDVEEQRILLVGGGGSARTLALLRLGLRGAGLQGADSVLLREGQVFAVPRPLMLEPALSQAVPELGPLWPRLPHEGAVVVLDPALHLGLPWTLSIAPLDHVVLFDNGAVGCRPSEPAEILKEVVRHAAPTTPPRPEVVTALSETLATARCHRLGTGDALATEDAIRRLAC